MHKMKEPVECKPLDKAAKEEMTQQTQCVTKAVDCEQSEQIRHATGTTKVVMTCDISFSPSKTSFKYASP